MYLQNCDSVRYVNRNCVLYHLVLLMKKELLPEEQNLIFYYCGVGVETPMGFEKLASHLQFKSTEHAKHTYHEVIRKTRDAIPGSELEQWIASY